MMNLRLPAILAALLLPLTQPLVAEEVTTLPIGAQAPDFDLIGVDGKQHKLAEYADNQVLAVLFTCNHCPTAQAVEDRVKAMVTELKDKSFQLIAISPNDPEAIRIDELGYSVYGDSFQEMKAHAEDQKFNFPYLFDGETQEVSRAFGVVATPHVYVFDQTRKLRYQGRLDDSKYADAPTVADARIAIDALLAGQPVPVETTRVFGCSTKWKAKHDEVGKSEEAWAARPVTVENIDLEGIKKLVKNDTKKLRLINCWATWCGPCVDEFPDLVLLGRQFESRGFDFISISLDEPAEADSVLEFLKSEHAALPKRTEVSVLEEGRKTNNYIYNSRDMDALAEVLDPSWKGNIPFSVLVAPGGKIVAKYAGSIDTMEARRAIVGHLGRFYVKP